MRNPGHRKYALLYGGMIYCAAGKMKEAERLFGILREEWPEDYATFLADLYWARGLKQHGQPSMDAVNIDAAAVPS